MYMSRHKKLFISILAVVLVVGVAFSLKAAQAYYYSSKEWFALFSPSPTGPLKGRQIVTVTTQVNTLGKNGFVAWIPIFG